MKLENHLFIDLNRLRDGNTEEFDVIFGPEIAALDPKDEVQIKEPIHVEGTANIADDELIVQLNIQGSFAVHCASCHASFDFKVHISNFVHNEPVEAIKQAQFDLTDLVREAFLLEIPLYPRCGGKECKNRHTIEKYLKKEGEDLHLPFRDL